MSYTKLDPCHQCGYRYDVPLLGLWGCPNCHGEGLERVDLGGCAPPVYVRDTPQEALGDALTQGTGAWRPGSSRDPVYGASVVADALQDCARITVPSRARAFCVCQRLDCGECFDRIAGRTPRSEQAQRRWRDRAPISERQRDQEAIDTIRAYNLACARRASDAAADLRSQRQASAVVGAILLVLSGLVSWWMLATAGVNLGGLL